MRGCGTEKEVGVHTFHIHALFLAKCGAEVLDLCGKTTLEVFSSEGMIVGLLRRKSVGLGIGPDLLDEGLAATEILENDERGNQDQKRTNSGDVRGNRFNFALLLRPVREAGKDMFCV